MNKLRRRILEKLAQMNVPDNLPTEEAAKAKPVAGSPPAFAPANYYPTMTKAFGARNITIINQLTDALNQGLYFTSDGKVHLPWMKGVNFNYGTDNVPSVDLKNLMGFAKQLYQSVFTNHGEDFKQALTSAEIAKIMAILKSSSFISSLSGTNPMGQLSSKIGGNIKTIINNLLLQIQ